MMSDRPERHKIKSILNPVTLVTAAILTVGLVLISLVILAWRNPTTGASTIPETTLIPAPTLTPRVIDPTRTPTPTRHQFSSYRRA